MIVVTTPTGDIGHQVLERLVAAGAPVRVVARDPSRIPDALRAHVEVVQGSHGDAAVVNQAFAGADAVFWLVPPDSRAPSLDAAYLDFTRPALDALQKHGVKRVVTVSALGRGTAQADRAGLVTASLAMDDLIAGTGVALRALAMPSFMDNTLRQVASLRDEGIFASSISPDRTLPTVATRDIAAVAADLLLDDSWSGQETVPVLGPEDLSPADMAAVLSDVLGKPIELQHTPLDAVKAQMAGYGASDAFVQGYTAMMAAKDAGLDEGDLDAPRDRTPTTFREWAETVLKPAVLA